MARTHKRAPGGVPPAARRGGERGGRSQATIIVEIGMKYFWDAFLY